MYDAVVIGSGIGGLGAAGLLARAGLKVAVVEQHTIAGGFAHSFRRGPYQWDAAVHYISECGPGGLVARVLDLLGVSDRVSFVPLDADGFDHLHFPDFRFRVPTGLDRYRQRLQAAFPREAKGIARFCGVMGRLWDEMRRFSPPAGLWQKAIFPLRYPALTRWAFRPVGALLRETVRDPRLRAVLVGQRADYGENPSRASLLTHAAVLMTYLGGAAYPRGGSQRLVDALVHAVTSRGGEVRLHTPAERIVLASGRVAGVSLAGGEVLPTRRVIVNADLWRTFRQLVGDEHLPPALIRRLERTEPSVSAVSVYLGTDLDLAALGVGSENHWFAGSYDVEAPWGPAAGGPVDFILSSPTRKDPGASIAPPGHHTLMLTTLVPYSMFAPWAGTRAMRRGPAYSACKHALAEGMIRQAEAALLPGLRQHITALEVGTPLTNEHYAWVTRGACYGPAQTARQVGPAALGPTTPIPGLWLAGANCAGSFGVVGALLGGVRTAAAVLEQNIGRLLAG